MFCRLHCHRRSIETRKLRRKREVDIGRTMRDPRSNFLFMQANLPEVLFCARVKLVPVALVARRIRKVGKYRNLLLVFFFLGPPSFAGVVLHRCRFSEMPFFADKQIYYFFFFRFNIVITKFILLKDWSANLCVILCTR